MALLMWRVHVNYCSVCVCDRGSVCVPDVCVCLMGVCVCCVCVCLLCVCLVCVCVRAVHQFAIDCKLKSQSAAAAAATLKNARARQRTEQEREREREGEWGGAREQERVLLVRCSICLPRMWQCRGHLLCEFFRLPIQFELSFFCFTANELCRDTRSCHTTSPPSPAFLSRAGLATVFIIIELEKAKQNGNTASLQRQEGVRGREVAGGRGKDT